MANTPVLPPNRHIPYKKGGWGAAILTLVATAAVFLTAYYIHTKTYRNPRDVMMTQVGEHPGAEQHATPQGTPAPNPEPGH